MFKQYIVIRKDLPMSPGKLSAQISHASLAFIPHMLKNGMKEKENCYGCHLEIQKELWDNWLSPDSSFTKVNLGVKNRNKAEQLIQKAKEMGLKENEDFFVIHDEARTELMDYKEEDGRVLTCIGFKPREESELKDLLGKLQLYK